VAFRDERLRVVGIGGTLREASTSPGALRRALEVASHTTAAMVHIVDRVGKLVVEMAEGLNPENRRPGAVGVAV
jgi:hypothetical protein